MPVTVTGNKGYIYESKLAGRTIRVTLGDTKTLTLSEAFSYCDYLQALGRDAHKDARSIFNLHVVDAWPGLAPSLGGVMRFRLTAGTRISAHRP